MNDPALRSFSPSTLMLADELIAWGASDLFVLTMPDGGLELGRTLRREPILWAYSNVLHLVESCGAGQPYVRTTVEEVERLASVSDLPLLIAFDIWHPEGARYLEPDVGAIEPIQPAPYEVSDTSVVWIPTRPVRTGDRKVTVELYGTKPGQSLLLAYSSLASLRENCGPHQAASAISIDRVAEVAGQAGAHGVAFEATIAEESRHVAPVVEWTRSGDIFR